MDLIAQFQEALDRTPVDIGRVLDLSQQLAAQDPEFVRFSVDAGLIDRLGRELVARPETAVAELIKNAYDADATSVTLSFKSTEKPGGQLVINDNGIGMNREQLISGFMRLSSTDKISEPVSPRLKRQRAGRKGIGRFAVQRLGERLEIVSQTKGAPKALRVVIDWKKFTSGSDLSSIASRIEEIEKQQIEGTSLTIDGLREAWTETSLKRVYRNVADLIQPFTLRDKRTDDGKQPVPPTDKDAKQFSVLLRRENGENVTVVDDATEVWQHALGVIEGFVDDDGQGYWSVFSEKAGVDEKALRIGRDRENHGQPFPTLRNVDFKAYYFIYRADLIPRSLKKFIDELSRERSGIRLYRNGYRVPPYGEPGDDWLSLDYFAQVRGPILVPISNKNFFGFVELYDPEGTLFEETASREGLLENDSFRELQDFVQRVLLAAAARIGEARHRKVTATQKNWQKDVSASARLRATAAELRAVVSEGQDPGTERKGATSPGNVEGMAPGHVTLPAEDVERWAAGVEEAATDQEVERQVLLQELGMLRVLSTLGLIISEFTHEVKHTLGSARLDARHLAQSLSEGSVEKQRADRLLRNIERFKSYASYFDRAIIEKNQRELIPQDMHTQVGEWHEIVSLSALRIGIELMPPTFESDELVTGPMHASELASVLFNFYTNAEKAINRASHNGGQVQIVVGNANGQVFIEFSDTGDGVPLEYEGRLFDAFFTTATPAEARASDEEALQGTGLGLKIVRDIAESYGGDVRLTDPPAGFSTCFRFEVPEATDEQKMKHGY